MKRLLLLCGLLGLSPVFAALPPGVTSRPVEKNVTLYERATSTPALPSFWDEFFGMFKIGKTTKAVFPFGRSVALLVGIGNYEFINPPLPFVSQDVQKVRDYLLSEGGFDAVYVMDEQATPQLVDNYMTLNLMHLQSEDRLWFYFSGHGADLDGLPLLEFQHAKPGDLDQAHVLRVDQYELWSKAIHSKHVLFIYDACFAGLAVAVAKDVSAEARASIAELSGNGSRTVITAGSGKQRAWIEKLSSQSQFSIFTEALIQALRTGAADDRNRGFVTIDQAAANATVIMAEMTRKLGPGHEMKPSPVSINANLTGSFVFLNPKASHPDVAPGDVQAMGIPIPKGEKPDVDRDLEALLWKSIVDLHDPNCYEDYLRRYPNGLFESAARALLKIFQPPAVPSDLATLSLADLAHLADQGSREAMSQLGSAYESGAQGAARDPRKAVSYYRQAVEKADGAAAYRLGEIFYNGREGIPRDFREAARWFERGGDLNNPDSLMALGLMYKNALGGLAGDDTKAAKLFQQAANLGNTLAVVWLGSMYSAGRGGLVHDEHKAAELFQQAADAGDTTGVVYLGYMYRDGRGGIPKDERKAVELFQRAARLGSGRGMANLGAMYAGGRGGLEKDERKAVELYRQAADLGDPLGMANLGIRYAEGRGGLPKDERKALNLYQQAADAGDAQSMVTLGYMYLDGHGGLRKDERKAGEFFQRASRVGNGRGIAVLGAMYVKGQGGLEKDERKAVDLFQQAADLGDPLGMANLGSMYAAGRGGLIKNERKAVELYQRAADLREPLGMALLGDMYAQGRGGLNVDRARAVTLYREAARLGDDYAKARLRSLRIPT